jgi:hypothetical protein
MRQIRGFSRGAVALAIAVTATFAAVAPSSAASRHHRHFAGYHASRVYRAYGAIPGGAGFAAPSYSGGGGYGYGYGDNSNSYTN